jgi:hypothetical protein
VGATWYNYSASGKGYVGMSLWTYLSMVQFHQVYKSSEITFQNKSNIVPADLALFLIGVFVGCPLILLLNAFIYSIEFNVGWSTSHGCTCF